jgi:hypothetical protein
VKKILILAANPKGTSPLRLDQEVRDISEGLRRSQHRDHFILEQRWATRPRDILRALLDVKPDIIHFCGHGMGEEGLALESNSGQVQLVSTNALARLFELFADTVNCIVLNACYSKVQAEAISQHVHHVIGMSQAIGDKAAVEFSVSFYDALGAGESVEFAYKLGCNAILMAGSQENLTPVLQVKPTLTSSGKTTSMSSLSTPANSPEQSPAPPAQSASLPAELSSLLAQIPSNEQSTNRIRVLINYCNQEPELSLARQLYQTLESAGHTVLMAAVNKGEGTNWFQQLDRALSQCDYFLLLLSATTANSEMVTETVRRVKELHSTRPVSKPVILPVRVDLPATSPLNYDLQNYLDQTRSKEWQSTTDAPDLLRKLVAVSTQEETLLPAESTKIITSSPASSLPDHSDHPPLPIAAPELPGGQVELASQFYLERPPIESDCYETIIKPGALIRIKAPRQMGKTSLMSRILCHAGAQGCHSVPLSFQLADATIFADLDKLLRWFCSSIGRRLRLPNRLTDYWDAIFGSKDNCTAYFEEYLLTSLSAPLVLGLDEVDCVFQYPEIAADFFGLLRAWHEEAKTRDLWKRLRLVVVHSTEVYIPLNINQSPFNVGLPIELPEFTLEQVQDLTHRHRLNWDTSQTTELMKLVGGHPYLVRMALYQIARQHVTLEQLLTNGPTEAGPFGDHLRRHLWNLEQRPEMAIAMKQIVEADQPVRLKPVQAFQLHSMGLVHLHGNEVTPRCNLYQQYFYNRFQMN